MSTSVLQDWVMKLPLRAQGTLLTGIRGCDLTPKYPLESTERQLVGYLRNCVMNPADEREIGIPGAFFQPAPPKVWKASELGHYPQHWVSHIMHCFEVVSYFHPEQYHRLSAGQIYLKLVHSFHLYPESKEQMMERLTEDRIAKGEVVS